MAGLEPARAFYGPTDFKSVASAIPPHRRRAPHFTQIGKQTKTFVGTNYSQSHHGESILAFHGNALQFL
jgi:hypothetical protein